MRQKEPLDRLDDTALRVASSDLESSECENTLRDVYCAKFVCSRKGCKLQFRCQDRLDQHEYSHTNIRKHVCAEEGCTKSYATLSHLRRHAKTNHRAKAMASELGIAAQRIACEQPDCHQSFTNRTSMLRHMRNKHIEGAANKHKCDQCDASFARKDQLRRHRYTHTGEMPVKCQHCAAGFLNARQLQQHRQTHLDQRRYNCDKCPQVFDKWSKLLTHRRQSHPLVCATCDRTFVKSVCYKMHLASHKETQEVFACVADNCPKYYMHQRNLNAHIRSRHSGDAGFECDMCGTRLTTKQKLQAHFGWHMRHPDRQLVRVQRQPSGERRKGRRDKGQHRVSRASFLTNVIEVAPTEEAPTNGFDDDDDVLMELNTECEDVMIFDLLDEGLCSASNDRINELINI